MCPALFCSLIWLYVFIRHAMRSSKQPVCSQLCHNWCGLWSFTMINFCVRCSLHRSQKRNPKMTFRHPVISSSFLATVSAIQLPCRECIGCVFSEILHRIPLIARNLNEWFPFFYRLLCDGIPAGKWVVKTFRFRITTDSIKENQDTSC